MPLSNSRLTVEKNTFDKRLLDDYLRLRDIVIAKSNKIELPAEPTVETLWGLCRTYNIDLDLFMNGRTDFNALSKRIGGDLYILPDRYSDPAQARSRGRTVLTIMDSFRDCFGQTFKDNVMRRLQLNATHRFHADDYVSLYLVLDMLAEVRRMGVSEDYLRWMGFRSAIVNRSTNLGAEMKKYSTGYQIYRAIHEEWMHFFDKNFLYEIQRINADSVDVRITVREETQDVFRSKVVGSRESCLVRQGTYASMTAQPLGYRAYISESACIYKGDSHCLYHLTWM